MFHTTEDIMYCSYLHKRPFTRLFQNAEDGDVGESSWSVDAPSAWHGCWKRSSSCSLRRLLGLLRPHGGVQQAAGGHHQHLRLRSQCHGPTGEVKNKHEDEFQTVGTSVWMKSCLIQSVVDAEMEKMKTETKEDIAAAMETGETAAGWVLSVISR